MANSLIIESDNVINIMSIAGIVSIYVMHTTTITTLEESFNSMRLKLIFSKHIEVLNTVGRPCTQGFLENSYHGTVECSCILYSWCRKQTSFEVVIMTTSKEVCL